MYAIIRSGGKQSKVHEGDLIDVELLRVEGEVDFTPLLVVDDAGTAFSRRDDLKAAKVTARVVGDAAGPKVDIFKYRAKTGYRRRQGHHQKYTTLEVLRIDLPDGAVRSEKAPAAAVEVEPASPAPVVESNPVAKRSAAAKPVAPEAKATTRKPAAAKAGAAKAKASPSPAKKATPRKKEH
jgi:large subunit ribosomal protein L21